MENTMPRRPVDLTTMFDNPQAIKLPAEPHPFVAAWIERQREAETKARKENRGFRLKDEDTYMGRRELRISDALFKAAEAKGHGLECPDGYIAPVSLRIKGRRVKWSLEEQTSSRHIPLSKKELKKPDNIALDITTEVIHVPTGTFKLIAETDSGRMKTQISERAHKPFEGRIEEVLTRFEKLVDKAIADEIRSAEVHREVKEEIKAKERPRRLRVIEGARWDRLRKQTRNWQEAKSLRTFIDAVERTLGEGEQPGRETAWLTWARKRADRLDPLSKGSTSARSIARWRYDPDPSEYELSVWELT
jgi:hypothetical protein